MERETETDMYLLTPRSQLYPRRDYNDDDDDDGDDDDDEYFRFDHHRHHHR